MEKSWKTKHLATYDTDMLLSYEIDGKFARNLCCEVSTKNEQWINGMKYFTRTFLFARIISNQLQLAMLNLKPTKKQREETAESSKKQRLFYISTQIMREIK